MNIFLSLTRYTWNSCKDRINKRKTLGYLVSRIFLGVPWGLGLVDTWLLSLETRTSLKPDGVSWMGPHWAGKATGKVMRGKVSYNNRRRKWSQKNKRRRKSSSEPQNNRRGKENQREAESQTTEVPQGKCSLLTEVWGTRSFHFISASSQRKAMDWQWSSESGCGCQAFSFPKKNVNWRPSVSGFLFHRPQGHADVNMISWKDQQGQEGRANCFI